VSFENWYQKHFVPEVWAFLIQNGLPQKALLLLKNASSHLRENIPISANGLIIAKFLPLNVTGNSPQTKE
jgi:hypothetical protein